MDARLVSHFADAAKSVFELMMDMTIEADPPTGEGTASSRDVSGIIGLSGDLVGAMELSFSRECAERIVARFIGDEAELGTEDFSDAIGEIANMIAGSAKVGLATNRIDITCPSVIIGPSHHVQPLGGSTAFCIRCHSESEEFVVTVRLKDEDANADPRAPNGTATRTRQS